MVWEWMSAVQGRFASGQRITRIKPISSARWRRLSRSREYEPCCSKRPSNIKNLRPSLALGEIVNNSGPFRFSAR
jgi:hypothetical protein